MIDYTAIDNIPKLRWHCRRGMLELDVLLDNFLSTQYAGLSFRDKQRFVRLLDCTDPELFTWLLGQVVPDDADLAIIVQLVRRSCLRRNN